MTRVDERERIDERDVRQLVDRLKVAERALEGAKADFERYRNSFDTAGELALAEALRKAHEEVQRAISELDAFVYPADAHSGTR